MSARDMLRLREAVEQAQYRTNPLERDMRDAIIEAVLMGLRSIVQEDALTGSIHDAQVSRYTETAINRVLSTP